MTISLNDVKFDLLKIIEPSDGLLEQGKAYPVRKLFIAYLSDLQKDRLIYDFSIDTANRENAITFDINIRMTQYRSPKKLKIHVGTFTQPWCAVT
jgi:hypothetical protein